ncbi:MAG: hypothetical protein ACK6DC_01745 [Planctomycetota bacterium]
MSRFPTRNPSVHPLFEEYVRAETRRQFFRKGGNALGAAALAALGVPLAHAADDARTSGLAALPL